MEEVSYLDVNLEEISPASSNENIAIKQIILDNNQDLLEATAGGEIKRLKEIIAQKNPGMNINCKDSLGRTPLTLAAENGKFDEEVIELLIDRGASVDGALLHAIIYENIEALKRILAYLKKQREKDDLENKQANIKNPCTPLLLACKIGNFEIVKLLVSHGERVTEHSVDCKCDVCSLAESNFSRAHIRLESYKVLSNPLYIAAQYMFSVEVTNDPVVQAFELSEKLKKLASVDYEFKDEYSALSENLEAFPVDLLDECLGMEETQEILRETCQGEFKQGRFEEAKNFYSLEKALRNENEKFVSHPYSQLLLNERIFHKYPNLRNVSWTVKYFLLPLLMLLLLPVIIFCHVFRLNSQVYNLMRTPLAKYMLFVCSYLLFLVVLIRSAFQPIQVFLLFTVVDWIICIYVIGFCFDIINEIYHCGFEKYFWNWYSYVLVAMVTSFIVYYALWTTGRTILIRKYRNWEQATKDADVISETVAFKAILFSYGFYCVGTLLAFLYLLSIVHLHPTLGPLLIAFMRMLKDLANFFLFFVILCVAFIICLKRLFLLYNQSYQNFFSLEMNQTTTWQPQKLAGIDRSTSVTFWALFRLIKIEEFKAESHYLIIKTLALILFGIFNVFAVLVALNMLIAILDESFSQQSASPDTKWKLSRTKVLISMMYRTNILPPPFNLLPTAACTVLKICQRIRKICCGREKCCSMASCSTRSQERSDGNSKRRKVIQSLVQRYLCTAERKKEKANVSKAEELEQVSRDLAKLLGSLPSSLHHNKTKV